MKLKIFALLTILSVLVIANIGSLSLTHGDATVCPLYSLSIDECSGIGSTIAVATHHLSGIQSLLQPIISLDVLSLVLFLLTFAIVFWTTRTLFDFVLIHHSIKSTTRGLVYITQYKLFHWFSICKRKVPRKYLYV